MSETVSLPMSLKSSCESMAIPAGCRESKIGASSVPAAPLRRLDVQVFGVSHLVKGYEVSRENPRFHTVLFTVDGSGRYESDNGSGRLSAGDLFIAATPCRMRYWTEDKWDVFWFHLHATRRWEFLQGSGVTVMKSPHYREMHAVAEALMAEEPLGDDPLTFRTVRLLGETIAAYLERELSSKHSSRKPVEHRKLRDLWRKVRERPSDKWTVANMARECGMSTRTLLRICACTTGTTPRQMLTRVRMEAAAAYLAETDQILNEIAGRVGYSTGFALSKAFKKHFGYSPRQLQRSLKAAGSSRTNVEA